MEKKKQWEWRKLPPDYVPIYPPDKQYRDPNKLNSKELDQLVEMIRAQSSTLKFVLVLRHYYYISQSTIWERFDFKGVEFEQTLFEKKCCEAFKRKEILPSDMETAAQKLGKEYEMILISKREILNEKTFHEHMMRNYDRYSELHSSFVEYQVKVHEHSPSTKHRHMPVDDAVIYDNIRMLRDIPEYLEDAVYAYFILGTSYTDLRRQGIINPKGRIEFYRKLISEKLELDGLIDNMSIKRIFEYPKGFAKYRKNK